MEGQRKRIILTNIYLGNAVLFGLLYGIILGLIFSVLIVVFGSFNPSVGSFLPGGVFIGGIVILIGYTLISILGMLIFALIYNIIASLGGKLHLGMAEYIEGEKLKKKDSSKSVRVDNKPVITEGPTLSSDNSGSNNSREVKSVKSANTAVVGK